MAPVHDRQIPEVEDVVSKIEGQLATERSDAVVVEEEVRGLIACESMLEPFVHLVLAERLADVAPEEAPVPHAGQLQTLGDRQGRDHGLVAHHLGRQVLPGLELDPVPEFRQVAQLRLREAGNQGSRVDKR